MRGWRSQPVRFPVRRRRRSESRDDVAERSLVGLVLRVPALLEKLARETRVRQCFSDKWRPVVDAIILEWQETGNIDIGAITQKLPAELASEFAALVLEAENRSDAECARMAGDCLTHLQRKYLKDPRARFAHCHTRRRRKT